MAVESRSIAGPGGQQLDLRFYRGASEGTAGAPLVLYAHGGGFVTGNLDTDHAQCVELARDAGCLVVSVDYRLAPENPCPAALDDVEAGFYYAIRNCAELDRRCQPHRGDGPRRGCRTGRGPGPAHVRLTKVRRSWCRSCTSRCSTPTPRRRGASFSARPGLNGPAVSRAWGHYLGHAGANGQHVPAHRANLEGLPPTFISCSEIDPCRDEAIDYANRLLHAFVHTELHVIAATFNGFDSMVPDWVVSQENRALHAQTLRRVFAM